MLGPPSQQGTTKTDTEKYMGQSVIIALVHVPETACYPSGMRPQKPFNDDVGQENRNRGRKPLTAVQGVTL